MERTAWLGAAGSGGGGRSAEGEEKAARAYAAIEAWKATQRDEWALLAALGRRARLLGWREWRDRMIRDY